MSKYALHEGISHMHSKYALHEGISHMHST